MQVIENVQRVDTRFPSLWGSRAPEHQVAPAIVTVLETYLLAPAGEERGSLRLGIHDWVTGNAWLAMEKGLDPQAAASHVEQALALAIQGFGLRTVRAFTTTDAERSDAQLLPQAETVGVLRSLGQPEITFLNLRQRGEG